MLNKFDNNTPVLTLIPKGMTVRAFFSCPGNELFLLDKAGSIVKEMPVNIEVNPEGRLSIGAVCKEKWNGLEACLEVYDGSAADQILIGKLLLNISKSYSTAYEWIPISEAYVAHLCDFLYPPASLKLFKAPGNSNCTISNY